MAKDTPEERPNLRPRLNKALREIERLKERLGKAEAMVFALVESSDGMSRDTRKQWADNVLGATADLKPELDA